MIRRAYILVLALLMGIPALANNTTQGIITASRKRANLTPPVEVPVSATINADGDTLTIVWFENKTRGTGYSGSELNVDGAAEGDNLSVSYASGDGTSTWVMSKLGNPFLMGETLDLDFAGGTDSIEDGSGNDLNAFSNFAIVNNSTQTSGSFTHIQSSGAALGGAGPYFVGLPGNITAGSLLMFSVVWEGASGTGNITVSEDEAGTKPFTVLTRHDEASGDLHVQTAYLLAATETDATIWFTFPASSTPFSPTVMEFSYTGTPSLDQANYTGAGTSGTTFTSGNITTTGSTELVIGAAGSYSGGQTFSGWTIGGSAATGSIDSFEDKITMFYRQTTGTINAVASGTGSDNWICQIISFKAE